MRTLLLSALLCTAAALPGRAVAAGTPAEPAPPQVAVEVSDDTDAAEAGDRLDYRITVRNLGDAPLPGARIEARLPATTESAKAPEGRVTDDHTAVWHADLAPGGLRVLTTSVVLGDRADGPSAAPGTLRAATTVCVHAAGVAAPAACTGDIDDLPETHGGTGPSWLSWTPWLLLAGLLAGVGFLLRGRRRTAAAAATAATSATSAAASATATAPVSPGVPAAASPPGESGEPAAPAASAGSART
ncbi:MULTISPECIES: hypothetical protein [Streptomyces]|uniref:DUF11 domain-containing protein n=1 Tax=Streptomyces ramulosus TaxID=47762 RepID=A0ABW1FJA3_9ACTN